MNHKQLIINKDRNLRNAMQAMDNLGSKLLIVVDDSESFLGLCSIGDIQRAILSGKGLDNIIEEAIRTDYLIARPGDSMEAIRQTMMSIRAEFMPVVNEAGKIEKVIYWNDIFEQKTGIPVNQFKLPVVVMAGGFGSRVKPLTNVLPKPLLPLGDKTMLEEIFSRFNRHGCAEFYLSVNYKADLIEFYLNSQQLPYQISYIHENTPLGTAGSLNLLKHSLNETFFVSNCDILIEQDYSEILDYHRNNNNEITIVSAIRSYDIPYGTLMTKLNGVLESITEKPSLNFQINSGMYILEPSVLHDIPENSFYHITHLIDKLISDGRRVGVFPVSEGSWTDMGTLKDYLGLLNKS